MNRVWQYPAPSGELEARRVLDLWRGVPVRPWSSRQEAHQHFRKAFAFFDTDGDGRLNHLAFIAGLVRLRYPLSPAAAAQLFDRLAAGRPAHITLRDFSAPLLGGGDAPKAWLRRSPLVAFDTARAPQSQQVLGRALHGRPTTHNGRFHPTTCARPCCGGDVAAPGYLAAPVHATFTSHASESARGDRNRFVSPPYRANDIPVPDLPECLTPAPLAAVPLLGDAPLRVLLPRPRP